MPVLNLRDSRKSEIPYNFFFMPDGQPHIQIKGNSKDAEIVCSIRSMNELGKLLVAIEACEAVSSLRIYYFLGARQDKVVEGEAVTSAIFGRMICDSFNQKNYYGKVMVLHPHSGANLRHLGEAWEIDWLPYLEKAVSQFNPGFLIMPDKGASKHAERLASKTGLPVVQCRKKRDPETGELSGFRFAENNQALPGRGLIVDDICDGGGTFIGLKKDCFPDTELGLYTTHGIYSKGFKELNRHFTQVFCTDSYFSGPPIETADDCRVQVFEVE